MSAPKLTEAQRNTETGKCDFCGERHIVAVSDFARTVRICGACAQWAGDMIVDAGRAALAGSK